MDNDSLVSRNEYLSEFGGLISRCRVKFDNLLKAIEWTEGSLKIKEPSLEHNVSVVVDINPLLEEEEPSAQLGEFEKRYNDLLAELPNQSKKTHEKSETQNLVELLEFERNAKRRRISYKNRVHTKNKSHTEVLRELVHEQMAVLKELTEVDTDEVTRQEKSLGEEELTIDGMIQVGFTRGNPHTLWKEIGQVVENREESRKSEREIKYESHDRRSTEFNRFDRSTAMEKVSSSRDRRHHDDRISVFDRREDSRKRERLSHRQKHHRRSSSGSKNKKRRRSSADE